MSKRIHANQAERQKAYRESKRHVPTQVPPPPPPPLKRRTRPTRLLALEAQVREMIVEYQTWRDAIPPNLAGGRLAEELDAIIAGLESIADDLQALEPPRIGR